MAYIETQAPRDYSLYTLFAYPYVEGVRNLSAAITCGCGQEQVSPSLIGRVAHLILGVTLLIPLVNTVVFVVLRYFFAPPLLYGTRSFVLDCNRNPELEALNAERNDKIARRKAANCLDIERQTLLTEIVDIEMRAASIMRLEDSNALVALHFKLSISPCDATNPLTQCDGQIIELPDDLTHAASTGSFSSSSSTASTTIIFSQVGGLTQLAGRNLLCGYYALFFMLQAVTGKSFTDRNDFNAYVPDWHQTFCKKKAATWLATHRDQDIPSGLAVEGATLSPGDMQYLIEKCDSLAPLREQKGCFMMEMDELSIPIFPEPVKLMGKSKTENKFPTDFPIYFILNEPMRKEPSIAHYYLIQAKQAGQFQVVHSLNYSISNPEFFDPNTFSQITQVLANHKIPH